MRRIKKMPEPSHFRIWKQKFREEQGYICCYCEQRIGVKSANDCDIEHFMPRHPDKNRLSPKECEICSSAQLEYDNLLVSCKGEDAYSLDHCNHKKDNWFDFRLCVSPITEEIEGLFGYRTNGKIFAVGNDERAEEMKKRLNLDTYVLQNKRKAAYDAVIDMEFGDSDELWVDREYVAETIASYGERDSSGRYVQFCSMITYCLEHY